MAMPSSVSRKRVGRTWPAGSERSARSAGTWRRCAMAVSSSRVRWRTASCDGSRPTSTSRRPSSQAVRAMSSCSHRTRRRSASRAMADGSGSSAAVDRAERRQLHPVEGGDHRRRPDARRHEGQDDRVALDEIAEVHALRSGLGQRGQSQRGAGDRGRAGLGDEEAGEGLVAVHAHEGVDGRCGARRAAAGSTGRRARGRRAGRRRPRGPGRRPAAAARDGGGRPARPPGGAGPAVADRCGGRSRRLRCRRRWRRGRRRPCRRPRRRAGCG